MSAHSSLVSSMGASDSEIYDITQEIVHGITRRHNEHDGVSSHQPHDCLLNRLFRHKWKKTLKLRVTGLCEGNSPVTGEFPHKGPVTQKMFLFDDVIMNQREIT